MCNSIIKFQHIYILQVKVFSAFIYSSASWQLIFNRHAENILPLEMLFFSIGEWGGGPQCVSPATIYDNPLDQNPRSASVYETKLLLNAENSTSCILVGNRPVYNKSWIDAGILCIKDLLNGNCFMTQAQIEENYNVSCDFLYYNGLRLSIPQGWLEHIFNTENIGTTTVEQIPSVKVKLGNKFVYRYKKNDLHSDLLGWN